MKNPQFVKVLWLRALLKSVLKYILIPSTQRLERKRKACVRSEVVGCIV
ncbi:hypothetical protein X975_11214, partial [Stegodyphus mimosarum]